MSNILKSGFFLPAKKQYIVIMTFLPLIFSSCSDVISVDLKNVEPQIVIDGSVTDRPGPYTVIISKTGDYFKAAAFPAVSGAVVIITDDAGNTETLKETEKGIYKTSTLQGMPGRKYTLTVSAEGKEYTASSTMPSAVGIDSLTYKYRKAEAFGPQRGDAGYELHCFFTDRAEINDHCIFKITCNGEKIRYYFLYDDKFTDGNQIDFCDFEHEIFELNDTLKVELFTLDEATYEYYSTLSDVIPSDTGPPMIMDVPSNPKTNLNNDALGYFGAFAVRAETVIVK